MRESVPRSAGKAVGAMSHSWAGIVYRTLNLVIFLLRNKKKKLQIKQVFGISAGFRMKHLYPRTKESQ